MHGVVVVGGAQSSQCVCEKNNHCSFSLIFPLISHLNAVTFLTMMEIDDDEMQGMGFQVSRRQGQLQPSSKIRGSIGRTHSHSHSHSHSLVVPGQTITSEQGFLRGHGTYLEQQRQGSGGGEGQPGKEELAQEQLVSSLAGVIERVNKLVSVHPPSSR